MFKLSRLLLAFGIAALCAAQGYAATIYKWTDADGQVHYSSSKPPANVKATVVDTAESVRTEPSATPATTQKTTRRPQPAMPGKRSSIQAQEAAFQQRRAVRLEQEARGVATKEEEAARMLRACDRARASLARTMATAPRLAKRQQSDTDIWVYHADDYVETPSMNNAERSETIEKLERFIAQNCAH